MRKPNKTVADLVKELQALPQHLPVLVSCHYDNDDGLRDNPSAHLTKVEHSEAEFYYDSDDPTAFDAVTVT